MARYFTGLEPLEPRLMMSAGPLNFTDQDGDRYSVELTGPGSMAVSRVDATVDGTGPIDAIELTGTTELSTLTVSILRKGPLGDGLVPINSITSDGKLKAIRIGKSDLVGEGITLGSGGGGQHLGSIRVRDILAGADVITGGDATLFTTIKARNVGDGTDIRVGAVLKSLTATTFGDSTIEAPSAVSILIKGDKKTAAPGNFSGHVNLTDAEAAWGLDTMRVRDNTLGASVRAASSIRSFSTGTLTDSNIFAGIAEAQTGLPDSADNFVNKFTGRIASVVVKGLEGVAHWITNSNIAAWRVNSFKGGFAKEDNGGTGFLLAASRIQSFKYTDAIGKTSLSKPHIQGVPFAKGDATIRYF